MAIWTFLCVASQISFAGGAPDRVRVAPASNLVNRFFKNIFFKEITCVQLSFLFHSQGLFWAGLRAVLKNMSMAFLFPVSITFLFLPFNRTV